MILRGKLKVRIQNLKEQLSKTDYKTLKYIEGQLSEEEFLTIKAERQALRLEINRLESLTDEQAMAEGLIREVNIVERPQPTLQELQAKVLAELQEQAKEGEQENEE